jgi:CRP-like cAMP-binding protein
LYLAVLFAVLKGVLGINITPFLATSALLTMILGLAFQGVLSNVLSGMSLHLTRSFSKGDWIRVGSNEGEVLDTNWRETRIVDLFSNIVILPNNVVASETLVNYSHPDKKTALTIPVKVSYEAPAFSVVEALCEAASDIPEVSKNPHPQAYITGYDDFGISYVLKFWITDFRQKYIITGKVGRLIWYKFKRRSIEIPVPLSGKLTEVLKTVEKERALEISRVQEERTFRDLVGSSFLRHQEGKKAGELLVPEQKIRKLALSVRRLRFAPGEMLFKQGDKGESCYVVASGRVKGIIVFEEKGKKYTSEFQVEPGGIFGEMSLFTGIPRTATCVVEEESELLEIEAKDFALLLAENPKLDEVMAGIVSARNRKNKAFLKKIKELSKKDMEESCSKSSVLRRLKRLVLFLKK